MLLGGVLVVSASWIGGRGTAASVATGWLVLAVSLALWKRIARRMLSGDPSGGARFALGVLGKILVTFGSVILAVKFYEVEVIPFLIGTSAFPVACLAAAIRRPVPEPPKLT